MGESGPDPSVSIEDILDTFRHRSDPCEPLTATEISQILDIPKRTALRHLNRTEEESSLRSKVVGANAKVWWLPHDTESSSGDE